MRGLLAVLAAAAGYAGATQSLALQLRGSDIGRAHALAPWDGRITALLSRSLFDPTASSTDRERADQMARLALRQDAAAGIAASTLGLDRQVRGDVPGGRRLLSYAMFLSRRDLPSQLWAIEDAVARGDVSNALAHYDIALRTSDNGSDLLFPVLSSAIADRPVRRALAGMLMQRPEWGTHFVSYAAGNGDPLVAVRFFDYLRHAHVPVSPEAGATLIGRLVGAGLFDEAWAYYLVTNPGADRRISRDATFGTGARMASPFDWTPAGGSGVASSIQQADHGGVFEFSTSSGAGGLLLQQMQMLPPGDYGLVGHSVGIDQPEQSRPYWVLRCRDGRELGRVVVPNSAEAGGVFRGRLDVPSGCPIQTLALIGRPSDSIAGVAGQIDRIRLAPIH